MSKPFLQAQGLKKSYQMGRVQLHVLKGVSVSVQRGEFVCIMGASGSGKSTLLHLLGALDIPDAGQVNFDGKDIFSSPAWTRDRLRNRSFGFVFQFYHLLPELNVLENVLIPCMVGHSIVRWWARRSELKRQAAEALSAMGLGKRLKHRPNELSGGERQRVAIARALANRPPVLLADEPTGNLDTATGAEILGALRRLNEQGQTIVMVTHDPKVAASAHRTITLVDGRISDKRNQAPNSG